MVINIEQVHIILMAKHIIPNMVLIRRTKFIAVIRFRPIMGLIGIVVIM